MKALKKLIPAAAMLVLCAAMMTTATFAWFNMNESVSVDTGTTNVTAPTNLQIAAAGADGGFTNATYASTATFTSDNEILPATVQNGDSALAWQTTNKATNDGIATAGTLVDLTLDTDGKATAGEGFVDKFFFNSYKMSLKNIGGTTINVKLDDALIKVTTEDTASADLYKSVCFMVIVDGETAPAVVWDDTTNAMQSGTTLITGSATDDVIATLASQEDVTVTVIAWMEGNKTACANVNVGSDALSFALDFGFKAETPAAPST